MQYGQVASAAYLPQVIELKLLCLKLLLALLEGVQSETIPRRIAASLDLLLLVRRIARSLPITPRAPATCCCSCATWTLTLNHGP